MDFTYTTHWNMLHWRSGRCRFAIHHIRWNMCWRSAKCMFYLHFTLGNMLWVSFVKYNFPVHKSRMLHIQRAHCESKICLQITPRVSPFCITVEWLIKCSFVSVVMTTKYCDITWCGLHGMHVSCYNWWQWNSLLYSRLEIANCVQLWLRNQILTSIRIIYRTIAHVTRNLSWRGPIWKIMLE